MRKTIILALILVLVSDVLGMNANVTEFDDSSSSFTLATNTTKYITLPKNATVIDGNISINASVGYNSLSQWEGNIINPDFERDAAWTYSETDSDFTGEYSTNITSGAQSYKLDKPEDIPCTTYYSNGTYAQILQSVNFSKVNNVSFDYSTGYTRGGPYNACAAVIIGSTKYWELCSSGTGTKTIGNLSSLGTQDMIFRLTYKNKFYDPECTQAGMYFKVDNIKTTGKPLEEFKIYVDSSLVFNNSGNLTDGNKSINIGTALNTCYQSKATCGVTFSAGNWVNTAVSDLLVRYNKTNSAVLEILSPTQIATSVSQGASYTVQLNISNTGSWNATNITFQTVSSGYTPNLNESISHNCANATIANGSSVLCSVTFSNLQASAEPDEKIRAYAIGTDNNDMILSDSIDVDITVTTVVVTGGGGGGGGDTTCYWKIYRPANRVIQSYGYGGYKTNPITIQVYNNASSAQVFSYASQGLKCVFKDQSQAIEGSSFGVNAVVCDYGQTVENGVIVVSGGSCTQSINVRLISNYFPGLWSVALFGGAGPAYFFGAWGITFLVIFLVYLIITQGARAVGL